MLLLAMMELVYRVKSNPKGHVALSENDEEHLWPFCFAIGGVRMALDVEI